VSLFYSCSEDTEKLELSNLKENEKRELMKETSILLGSLLSDKNVKEEVMSKMKEVDEYGELVSFAYLFDLESGLKENETSAIKSNKKKQRSENLLKLALVKEFSGNETNYQAIKKEISKNYSNSQKARTSLEIANNLSSLLASQELQVFYPYDPEYANDDRSVQEFYVSYDPLSNTKTNTGYKFVEGSKDFVTIDGLSNSFLDNNPVYVIVPIDDCDIPGRPCTYIQGTPSSYDPITGDYNKLGTLPWTKDGIPPPLINQATLLPYNVNHNLIPEGDIVSSYIPKIKVNGTEWMGWGGTHQKLRFFRASADGKLTQNADGSITVEGNKYLTIDVRIKRKDINKSKNRVWIDVNAEFDSDWNMSENSQSIAVFSVHDLKGEASFDLSAKAGIKFENGAFVPTVEATRSVTVKVTTGSAKFRANVETSRRQVLSTITGATNSGTILDNGIEYNVKKVGIVEYYYKHWYTDLTP